MSGECKDIAQRPVVHGAVGIAGCRSDTLLVQVGSFIGSVDAGFDRLRGDGSRPLGDP